VFWELGLEYTGKLGIHMKFFSTGLRSEKAPEGLPWPNSINLSTTVIYAFL